MAASRTSRGARGAGDEEWAQYLLAARTRRVSMPNAGATASAAAMVQRGAEQVTHEIVASYAMGESAP